MRQRGYPKIHGYLIQKKNHKIQIICLTQITKLSPVARKEWREIQIKGSKKVSLNQNCFGEFNEERLWAETTLDSDNNIANYWLPRKNNFLKSYPGIDEPKIMKVLEHLPEELKSESQPFGELLKNADQIDFNVKTSHRLDTQWYHNIGLYSLGGSSWMMFGLAILAIYCVNRNYRNQQIIARN